MYVTVPSVVQLGCPKKHGHFEMFIEVHHVHCSIPLPKSSKQCQYIEEEFKHTKRVTPGKTGHKGPLKGFSQSNTQPRSKLARGVPGLPWPIYL